VAGVAALLLEAHPGWGPYEVLEALRSTADHFDQPSDHYGYGTARAELAEQWAPSTGTPGVGTGAGWLAIYGANPAVRAAQVELRIRMGRAAGEALVDLFDVAGRRVRALLRRPLPAEGVWRVMWDGADDGGRRVPGGVYFVRFQAPGVQRHLRLVVFP
jgi:hypothetical protein